MRTRFAVLLMFLAVVPGAPAQTLPSELAHLLPLVGDAKQLVDAARRFDVQQKALMEWDDLLIEQYMDEGKRDLAETKMKDLERRIELTDTAWRFVLGHYPNDARANNYYGEFLYDIKGEEAKALTFWLLAVRLDEKLSLVHNNLGVHYFHVGEYDKGLKHLGRALDLEPKNPDYLYNMAQMYLIYFPQLERKFNMPRAKLYKEAMRLSENAVKYAPDDYEMAMDYAVNFFAAENFGVQADWAKAAKAWEAARKLARNQHDVFYTHLNEARVWIEAKNWAKALPALEAARAIEPDSVIVQELIEKTRTNLPPAAPVSQ